MDTPLRTVRTNIVQSIRAFRVPDLQEAAQGLGHHFLYANLANATYNLELLLAGAAVTTAHHSHSPAPGKNDQLFRLLNHLSSTSTAAYQGFLRKPGFIDSIAK